ncbi:hypothetical protein E8E13_007709 [Curvularia kusanoi]|uniref:Uncharacterized protein n=1 Tax=Curvularia kusanoi TaxID=90978 RepID=A0A9P4TAF4_CURKU|nr:hypothetical protein E8E13_007709 [Curvularia kusanoi]
MSLLNDAARRNYMSRLDYYARRHYTKEMQSKYLKQANDLKAKIEAEKDKMDFLVVHHDFAADPVRKLSIRARLMQRADQIAVIVRTFNLAVAGIELSSDPYGEPEIDGDVVTMAGIRLDEIEPLLSQVSTDSSHDMECGIEEWPLTQAEYNLCVENVHKAVQEAPADKTMEGNGDNQVLSKDIVAEAEQRVVTRGELRGVQFVDQARSHVQKQRLIALGQLTVCLEDLGTRLGFTK